MPYMTDVKPALARFGLGPYLEEVPGWETRGSAAFAPACTIGHHTAGPLSGDRPSLNIVVNGRAGLSGPLANDFLSRSKVILVAAGRANHAGAGGFRGLVGNSAALGNEAESTGVGRKDGSPDWTEFQRWAFPRVHAAHLWLLGRDASWYAGHRDWTTRKIDPTDIDTVVMRREIAELLADPDLAPAPTPSFGDDMRLVAIPSKAVYKITEYDVSLEPGIYRMGSIAKGWGIEVTQVSLEEFLDIKADVDARRGRLLADVAKATGGDVDEELVVAKLIPAVTEAVAGKTGATREEIAELLRGITLRAS